MKDKNSSSWNLFTFNDSHICMPMKSRYSILTPATVILMIATIQFSSQHLRAQEQKASQEQNTSRGQEVSLEQTVFENASVKWDLATSLPSDIQLDAATILNKSEYLVNLRQVFALPDQLEFVQEKESTGPHGDRHIRFTHKSSHARRHARCLLSRPQPRHS